MIIAIGVANTMICQSFNRTIVLNLPNIGEKITLAMNASINEGFFMVLRSSQSDVKLPSIEMMPDSIKVLLNKIKQRHYEKLYELDFNQSRATSSTGRD